MCPRSTDISSSVALQESLLSCAALPYPILRARPGCHHRHRAASGNVVRSGKDISATWRLHRIPHTQYHRPTILQSSREALVSFRTQHPTDFWDISSHTIQKTKLPPYPCDPSPYMPRERNKLISHPTKTQLNKKTEQQPSASRPRIPLYRTHPPHAKYTQTDLLREKQEQTPRC